MIDKNSNKNIRLKFLQVYEDFNKEIPDELIEIFKKIKILLGEKTDSFKQILKTGDLSFIENDIKIIVDFEKINNNKSYSDKDIVYYSNIDLYDLIYNSDKIIKIPIKIKDTTLNNNKLYSVISHEIRHIYDFFTINDESDFNSFVNSLYYSLLKKENDEIFNNFLDLVYLSLEHELIARNTMIYENFINSKCSLETLQEEFKKTSIYESLILLRNFDYNKLLDLKYLNNINLFIDKFGGNKCENILDVENFLIGWKKYFVDKSNEYMIESNDVLNKIYNVIKETYEYKKLENVKDILKRIYDKYILHM